VPALHIQGGAERKYWNPEKMGRPLYQDEPVIGGTAAGDAMLLVGSQEMLFFMRTVDKEHLILNQFTQYNFLGTPVCDDG
jgi:hypothetical protein